jgi:hypothetical protein
MVTPSQALEFTIPFNHTDLGESGTWTPHPLGHPLADKKTPVDKILACASTYHHIFAVMKGNKQHRFEKATCGCLLDQAHNNLLMYVSSSSPQEMTQCLPSAFWSFLGKETLVTGLGHHLPIPRLGITR